MPAAGGTAPSMADARRPPVRGATQPDGRREVRIAVSIDTECDKGPDWKTRHPLRFRSVTEGIAARLHPLFREHGIVPTYLLSPEILRDEASVAALRALEACELGTHLHGEFIEPDASTEADVTSTPQLAYPPDIERRKLENLTRLFESRFGRAPKSFRAGRFALSAHTLGFLDELGYAVDSSVTPFRTNEYDGGVRCNYWGAPLAPYHPSRRDPRRPGSLGLVEVPVTIFVPRLASWPPFLLRRMSDRSLRRAWVRAICGGTAEKLWVRPFRGTPEQLASWADTVIARWAGPSAPLVNVMFHSVEAVPGASPYAQTEDEVARLTGGLDHLFRHLRSRYRLVSAGLADLHEGTLQ